MAHRLSEAARAAGHRLLVRDTLPSTNAEALAAARGGAAGPLWIVARRQTAGRGRRGSAWISPPGNLAASLLWPVDGVPPGLVPTLGFVAGLALARALEDVATQRASGPSDPHPHPEGAFEAAGAAPRDEGEGGKAGRPGLNAPFRLKWPNDVVVDGAKLAGLLLEAETRPGGGRAVAIGFGVNVAAAPDGLPYPATSLAQAGVATDAATLLAALSARFVEAARLWDDGRGFPAVRAAWLARACGLGAPVTVRVPGRASSGILGGILDGIDEGGRLVILAPEGTRHTVTAGEVHFGEAATAA